MARLGRGGTRVRWGRSGPFDFGRAAAARTGRAASPATPAPAPASRDRDGQRRTARGLSRHPGTPGEGRGNPTGGGWAAGAPGGICRTHYPPPGDPGPQDHTGSREGLGGAVPSPTSLPRNRIAGSTWRTRAGWLSPGYSKLIVRDHDMLNEGAPGLQPVVVVLQRRMFLPPDRKVEIPVEHMAELYVG